MCHWTEVVEDFPRAVEDYPPEQVLAFKKAKIQVTRTQHVQDEVTLA
jgi:hypothetical protein